MKWFRRLTALFLCTLMAAALAGCGALGDKGQIRTTLGRFEAACRELDLNAILDCVDPDTAGFYRAGAGLVGSLAGMDSEETLDAVVPFLFGENYSSDEFLRSLKLKVDDIAVSGDSATALCTLSYTSGGAEEERSFTVTLVRTQGEEGGEGWYISHIS